MSNPGEQAVIPEMKTQTPGLAGKTKSQGPGAPWSCVERFAGDTRLKHRARGKAQDAPRRRVGSGGRDVRGPEGGVRSGWGGGCPGSASAGMRWPPTLHRDDGGVLSQAGSPASPTGDQSENVWGLGTAVGQLLSLLCRRNAGWTVRHGPDVCVSQDP